MTPARPKSVTRHCSTARVAGRFARLFVVTQAFLAIPAFASPRVLLISVDGLRIDVATPTLMPKLAALQSTGTTLDDAINDLPSVTMTNHASMLTGQTSAEHGVIVDTKLPGEITTPTVFRFLGEAGLRSAAFLGKTKLGYLTPRADLETVVTDGDTANLVTLAIDQIVADGPDFIFVHLRDPDSTGHARGWMSSAYLEAVTFADEQIGRLVDAADADASRATYTIITADHGGDGPNHFVNIEINRRIPFVVVGPDIPAGNTLAESVSTPDVAPTVMWLLGVAPPDGLAGRALTALKSADSPSGQSPPPLRVPAIGPPCAVFAVPLITFVGLLAAYRRRNLRA